MNKHDFVKKVLWVGLAALLVAGSAVFVAFASPIGSREGLSTATLDNGLVVIVKELRGSSLVTIDLLFRTGSAADPPEKSGMMHLIEHMLFQAVGTREDATPGEYIESLGGVADAETTRDFIHIEATVLSTAWERALIKIAQAAREPLFLPEDIAEEKRVMTGPEWATTSADLSRRLSDVLFRTAYGPQGYGLTTFGTPETLPGITRDDLVAHHKRYFVPNNAVLVVAGDVDGEAALKAIRNTFGPWQRAGEIEPIAPQPQAVAEQSATVPLPDAKETVVGLAFLAPPAADRQDVCTMDVLWALLGRGQGSRLYRKLVTEQSLASRAGGEFLTQRGRGLCIFWAVGAADAASALESALRQAIAEVSRGVSVEEVERAKDIAVGVYALDSETARGQALSLAFYAGLGAPDMAVDYERLVRAVTPEDVQRVAKRYLDPSSAVTAALGPQ